MTAQDPEGVELYDGTKSALASDDLWVRADSAVPGPLQMTAAMRILDVSSGSVSVTEIHEGDERPTEIPLSAFREAARDGDLFPLGYFLDNQAAIRADLSPEAAASIPEMVMDVWGSYTEFQEYGPEYVSYLIEGDIREIRGEMQDQAEIDKEFADIAINAIRALEEFGSDSATEIIRWRLQERMDGDQDEIIKRYTEMWTGHISDPSDFKR